MKIQRVKQQFGLIGHADKLDAALKVAIQVAPTDMRVLIHGPSGSGKESFSKIIHTLSKRKHNTFIAVNCGAIPEGTIDSELFGHEKGAFTGAQEARKGYFETSNKGTIFLDEVGEMPLSTQARLLRVLENGEYIRVGTSQTRHTDVRVIAATNVDLQQAIKKKRFREDLYYRLNTVPIYVPSLAERKEDIPLLFESFTLEACERHKRPLFTLDKEGATLLQDTHFPGNIRQLKNIAEQISLLEEKTHLSADVLRAYLPTAGAWLPTVSHNAPVGQELSEKELLYKLLFDMRRDVHELKKLLYQLLQNMPNNKDLLAEHSTLFDEVIAKKTTLPPPQHIPYALPETEEKNLTKPQYVSKKNNKIEDIAHEHAEELQALSLQANEKDMIERALRKHAFKRKFAAQELGISERTLYRKIKYYDI